MALHKCGRPTACVFLLVLELNTGRTLHLQPAHERLVPPAHGPSVSLASTFESRNHDSSRCVTALISMMTTWPGSAEVCYHEARYHAFVLLGVLSA